MLRFASFVVLCVFVALTSAEVASHGHYVPTPGGWVWSTCVHEVESGSHVFREGNTLTLIERTRKQVLPPCPMPRVRRLPQSPRSSVSNVGAAPLDGWQIYTEYNNENTTLTSFTGFFSVPPAPAKFGNGVLFAFPGLEDEMSDEIIQPVLQYGHSADGGGKYWAVASWYVTSNDRTVKSALMNVTTNDTVFGNMTLMSGNTWFISGSANGKNTSITVTRPPLVSQPTAYTTLELYTLASCAQEPPTNSTILFSGMKMADKAGAVTPTWKIKNNGIGMHCNATMTVVSPSQVVLKF